MDQTIVRLLFYVELTCCLTTVVFLIRNKAAKEFAFLTAFLSVRAASGIVLETLLYLARHHVVVGKTLYPYYFATYWSSYALEAVLSLMVVYGIFRLAMVPLEGLRTLGMLVFRWATAISVALAIGMALGPKVSSHSFLISLVTLLQQTSSILTLCLLLFVCFAIRPMGLSYRSRLFGVSFGLGILAAADLASSAWSSLSPSLYSVVNVVNGTAICLTLITWTAYFALPEPKRRIIVLPTTSPFLRWNQISMALGDNPGYVAIGGIPPEVFAPAEIEVMRRASLKMTERLIQAPDAEAPAFQSLTA